MEQEIMGFSEKIKACGNGHLCSHELTTLQVNLGKKCNLACTHCHVGAGPNSTEVMSHATVLACLNALANPHFTTLDLTGGAPELHPDLVYLICEATKMGKKVLVRTNLVALADPQRMELLQVYRDNKVTVIASLPCYGKENVDAQRGNGTYDTSIQILQKLNALGYGKVADLELNLVYNPAGPFLPGPQGDLEAAYKEQLFADWGIVFNSLFTITNLPLGRFKDVLQKSHSLAEYNQLLAAAFNPQTVANLMCLKQLSVSWDGRLYDCDFNQVLALTCKTKVQQIADFDYDVLANREVALANHCYGCTAGAGSSCCGVLV